MLTSQAVADWLKSKGVNESFSTDGKIPTQPDRLIIVTITGGAGTLRERTFDQAFVQVRVRGRQRDNRDAEALAGQVDDVFMAAVPPVVLDGRRVVSIDYVGGPPGFLQRDNAERAHFACSYVLQVARSTF